MMIEHISHQLFCFAKTSAGELGVLRQGPQGITMNARPRTLAGVAHQPLLGHVSIFELVLDGRSRVGLCFQNESETDRIEQSLLETPQQRFQRLVSGQALRSRSIDFE